MEEFLKSYSRRSIRNFMLWIIILAVLPFIYISLKNSSIGPIVGNNNIDSLQKLYSASVARSKILQDSLNLYTALKIPDTTKVSCDSLSNRIRTLESVLKTAEFSAEGTWLIEKENPLTVSFIIIHLISINNNSVSLTIEDLFDNKTDTVTLTKTDSYTSNKKTKTTTIKLNQIQGSQVILFINLYRKG